ncbi:unnamed protein product, partial [Didymodactylos carnosus]
MVGLKRQIESHSTHQNGHKQHKRKKLKKSEEENDQSTWFESEIFYDSTVTQMKITELLNEVNLKQKQRMEIEKFIENVSKTIRSIPEGKTKD